MGGCKTDEEVILSTYHKASLYEVIQFCATHTDPETGTYAPVLMEMTYNAVTRLVEVYSYREKSTGTLLYAYCYKDNKIESFRVDRIEDAKATETPFQPRWPIEIGG